MRGFVWSLAATLMITGTAGAARADVLFAIESAGEGLWQSVLVATAEGRRYRIVDPTWGELVLREILEVGDFDGDGLTDALIAMDTGGNCCPQDFAVVSYRGEGFFATLGPPESMGWGGIDVIRDEDGFLIRSHHASSGVGKVRHHVRVKWWSADAQNWRQVAMSVPNINQLPDGPLPDDLLTSIYPADAKPVFFGHYWMSGEPELQSANALCLDYSAGTVGPLVTYTHIAGSRELSLENVAIHR